MALAEQLATASRLSADQKASTYNATASTLPEKLSCSTKQFKAYYVALLADKEYSKVLDTVAKADKTFKGQTTPANQRPGPSRFPPRCYECGVTGHIPQGATEDPAVRTADPSHLWPHHLTKSESDIICGPCDQIVVSHVGRLPLPMNAAFCSVVLFLE